MEGRLRSSRVYDGVLVCTPKGCWLGKGDVTNDKSWTTNMHGYKLNGGLVGFYTNSNKCFKYPQTWLPSTFAFWLCSSDGRAPD